MLAKTHEPLLLSPPRHTGAVFGWISKVRPNLSYRKLVLVLSGTVVIGLSALTASFFIPRSMAFSFAGQNCISNPVLMPNFISKSRSSTYEAAPVNSLHIGGYPVYAATTCVTALQAPKPYVTENMAFGYGLFKKQIKINSTPLPSLLNMSVFEAPQPVDKPLELALSSTDKVFGYRLEINGKTEDCEQHDGGVVCDITKLGLTQSAKYEVRLERMFGSQPSGTVAEGVITTVESVQVVASSIANEQMVYTIPAGLSLALNRPAINFDGLKLVRVNGNDREEVPITATVSGTDLTVTFTQPLARSASFALTLDKLGAEDGGYLATPYTLNFKTSGGPKVLGSNIGSYKVSQSTSVVINLDSEIASGQALENYFKLEAGGSAVSATVSARGNTVTIKPNGVLPRCAALTVSVLDGVKNSAGISGGSAWSLKSRTICQSIFSIGSSVQGRAISAYSFGSGDSKIVFVGATHGDEKSSALILNSLIDHLERSGDIPANHTIVIIPVLNPDGYAANRRTNAHGVDLNRNFPASNWKQGVTMPDKSFNANGGGSAPLSEPESAAIAGYLTSNRPRLVLTYHAVAGVVIPNDSGDSVSLAKIYDSKSNVGFVANGQTNDVFEYDTTGAMEDWLHEKPGITALLIELWTHGSNEFGRHQSAMMTIVHLP